MSTTVDQADGGDPGEVTTDDVGLMDPDEVVAKKKHPLALRWMHWVNFPVLMIMIWSGMRIYWADLRDPYAIGIADWQVFEFWPDSVNSALVLERRLAKGLAFHLTFGWFFVINGVLYGLWLLRKGRWRYLVPDLQGVRDAGKTVLHDLHLRKTRPPQGKYNPAQQLTYSAVLAISTLLVLTGFAIYKPVQLSFLLTILGGYDFARFLHFSMTIALLVFFGIHLIQVARSGWRNFASMITGYVTQTRREASPEPDVSELVAVGGRSADAEREEVTP
ncbi:MAG: cytochrome b/b6 domain-containing protein [Actinomycetota bacterium]